MQYRTERDPLGELQVPADAYWGVQTARAAVNFPISGLRAPADLVTATNLLDGRLRDQFIVDVYQAGGGAGRVGETRAAGKAGKGEAERS